MRDVLGGNGHPLFETPAIFHPFGTGLAMHTHAFASAFAGATVLAGQSIVTAQNVVLLASVALNGFVTWLLAWKVTRHAGAASIAGLYFASAPYFAGHLLGHFNLIPAWMLPLFALVWLGALERGSIPRALAAGVVVAATLWTDYYYATYVLVFMAITLGGRWMRVAWTLQPAFPVRWPDLLLLGLCALLLVVVLVIRVLGGGVFFVGGARVSATTGLPLLTALWALLLTGAWRRWRPWPKVSAAPDVRPRRDLALAIAAAATTVAGAWPILREAVRLWQSDDFGAPPGFLRSAAAGVDPLSVVAGNPFHSLWGGLVTRFYDAASMSVIENTAWFGVAALGLLVVTRAFRRLPGDVSPDPVRFWSVTAVVFMVWSLGPYLRVSGENTGLYLPAAVLRLLPVANNIRIPGRAVVMVYLSLGMLLAFTVAWLPMFRSRWRVAAVAGLLLIDFAAVPLPLVHLPRPAMYERLALMPAGAVLELPMGIRDGYGEHGALDHRTLFHQSIHGKPIVGGFVARMSESLARRHLESPLFGPLLILSRGEAPAPGAIDLLRRDGHRLLNEHTVRYVVLSRQAPLVLRDVVAGWPLRLVAGDDEREMFEVR